MTGCVTSVDRPSLGWTEHLPVPPPGGALDLTGPLA